MGKCEFCINKVPELKEINMYEHTDLNGQKYHILDIERPYGYIPEAWRNRPLQINFCPMCGRRLDN
jgi:hypothetical protein